MADKSITVSCRCEHEGHSLFVTLDEQGVCPEVSFGVRLDQSLPWYRRLAVAFRYVFGLRSDRLGDYDEVLVGHCDQVRIRELLSAGIDATEKWNSRFHAFARPLVTSRESSQAEEE